MHAPLHVDRTALSLIRQLLVRPGAVALDYVSGRRRRHYGPFAFLVVAVALASGALAVTGFSVAGGSVPNGTADFLQRHVNLLLFLQVPMLAAACRLLTPRGPFNYAEYLVLASYASGMHALLFTVIDVGGWYVFAPSNTVATALYFALMPIWPLYLGFACTQFLPGSKLLALLKGILAWIITFAVTQGVGLLAGNIGTFLPHR